MSFRAQCADASSTLTFTPAEYPEQHDIAAARPASVRQHLPLMHIISTGPRARAQTTPRARSTISCLGRADPSAESAANIICMQSASASAARLHAGRGPAMSPAAHSRLHWRCKLLKKNNCINFQLYHSVNRNDSQSQSQSGPCGHWAHMHVQYA